MYWACHDEEAMDKLAQARQLAWEAQLCKAPAPQAKPAPPPPPPAPKKEIVLKSITGFTFDRASLLPSQRAVLDDHEAVLEANPDVRVEIAGHTDNVGTTSYNQVLSERRARTVFDYFCTKGISSDRMRAVGYGESRPIAPNDTEEGRAANRRVDFRVER